MLALAGYPLGLHFRFLEPADPAPADGVGEVIRAPYDDAPAVRRFARGLDLVTYEFESVPADTVCQLETSLPVYPSSAVLRTAQDRVAEKKAFERLGVPTAAFHPVHSRPDLEEATERVGFPAVLKTRHFGYDGKGQTVIDGPEKLDEAWAAFSDRPLILEAFVSFERELSILGARSHTGQIAFYPLVENEHRGGILHATLAPAELIGSVLEARARAYLQALMVAFDYVGVLALELFQQGDELLANEVAPRVHNSGHWTLDGARTSQFENHLRAILGLPLGSAEARGHTGMVNLIGRLPATEALLAIPEARLHLYDKQPRPGRKLGHVNVVATNRAGLRAALKRVNALLD